MAGPVQIYTLLADEENQKSPKEIVASLGWLEDLPMESGEFGNDSGRIDWTKINVAKSKFSMLKSIEMRHPKHQSCKVQLHPAEEQDVEITFTLEENEEFVGFQFFEVKNSETGASEWYHPHVLIRALEKTYVEPLSGHFFYPAPFPGRRRWLPATAESAFDGTVKGDEVIGLRTMPGQACSHVVGVLHKPSFCSCNVQSITGQSMMFWFDQVVLVGVLFYADIFLDLKQLKLFYDQDLVDYMAFNAFGLLIPPIVTLHEAFEWSRTPSPELSFFQSRIQSEVLQKIVITAAVASQSHVLLLVMLSMKFRSKHPLLRGAKDAEVAESTISALVQTNFLVSFLAEVDAIAKLALTIEQLQSMAISVAISCLSAGLSFAGRDKSDGMVLSLPGKVGWGPTMGCLVLVRAMEVASRMVAFNIIQVSMRGGWCGHVGGPLAVLVFVLASGLCFPEAKLVDVLASVTAHPGQILEPQSLLPLWRSLTLHGLLALAAGGQQVLLRTHRAWMPSDAKELPPKYLVGWLLITACSFLGLICLSFFGRCLEQPVFSQLREKGESIKLSSLVAAFDSKDSQVPKAAVAALGDALINIDTSDKKSFEKLIDCNGRVQFSEVAFHHLVDLFNEDGGDPSQAAACGEVLLRLKHCNVVSLNLQRCHMIPSTAWQKLRGASWTNLKEANFSWCFHDYTTGTDGAADLLGVLRNSPLEKLNFEYCTEIPSTAWQKLRGASWTNLREANFYECFHKDTKGADGAADLLEVLRNSPLEKLNFACCSQIPSTAWQKLRGASWTNLREANFYMCFHKDTTGTDGAADLLEVLRNSPLEKLNFAFCSQIPSTWQKLRGASWTNLREANFESCFDDDTKGADGAADLLEVLRNSPLEKLNFECCDQIPSTAWQKLRGASWTNLREANFESCFYKDTKGADGAADLLEVLRNSPLEKLNFQCCDQIPSTAWHRVPNGAWPALGRAPGIPKEELLRIVSGGGGHRGYAAAMAPEETGKDAQDDETNTMGQKHLQVVFAADIVEAAAFELLNNLCHSSPEKLNFHGCSQIPSTAWQKLRGASWTSLREANFSWCFDEDTKGADGAADLLEVLRNSPLEKLNFQCCSQIRSTAWQKLRGASWTNLREANFESCFDWDTKGADGAADLLEVLRNSPLEKLNFEKCAQTPSTAWQKLRGASWTHLREANFSWCFNYDTKGADGAADLLEVLRNSPLEKLNFQCCARIPSTAWQRVPSGAWPALRDASGIPGEELHRIRGGDV